MATPGCTLRRLLVDLVREMWVPDGNRFAIWNDLVGGQSFDPDNLIWAMEELQSSHRKQIEWKASSMSQILLLAEIRADFHTSHLDTVRISNKTTVRLLACEWHIHEPQDFCEGSEEYKLLPEHLLKREEN